MVKMEMTYKQIEKVIKSLPLEKRAELVRHLMKDTWEERFQQLLARVRARVKKYPITQEEVDQIVEETREEYHAKNRR